MPDLKSKTRWEADNVLHLQVKINRNQDPELYAYLQQIPGPKGSAVRDLLRAAIEKK